MHPDNTAHNADIRTMGWPQVLINGHGVVAASTMTMLAVFQGNGPFIWIEFVE